jgi:3-methylcrotonyl-CoA carboxylase alpha subunit
MIAKLVTWGGEREDAVRALADTVAHLRVWPVRTNAAFLHACLTHRDFLTGKLDTGFIAAREDALTHVPEPTDAEWKAAALGLFAPWFRHRDDDAPDPWRVALGFRLNADDRGAITVQHAGERRRLGLPDLQGAEGMTGAAADGVLVYRAGSPFLFTLPNFAAGAAAHGDGEILAPMPGKVITVDVAAARPSPRASAFSFSRQ